MPCKAKTIIHATVSTSFCICIGTRGKKFFSVRITTLAEAEHFDEADGRPLDSGEKTEFQQEAAQVQKGIDF